MFNAKFKTLGLSAALLAASVSLALLALERPALAEETKPGEKPVTGDSEAQLTALMDREIKKVWERDGIKPAERASDEEFLRRVYLDTVGVPPTYDEAVAFYADKDEAKRSKLIDKLVADERFGRHIGDLWSVVMMGRGQRDLTGGGMVLAQWLAERVNRGDGFNNIIYDVVTATGGMADNPAVAAYLAAGGNQYKPVDMTGNLTKYFTGVQIQCAQCHKHPYEEITTDDFFGVQNFFKFTDTRMTQQAEKGLPAIYEARDRSLPPNAELLKRALTEEGKAVLPKFLFGETYKLDPANPPRKALAAWMTSPDNVYFREMTVNRYMARFLGVGFVHPVDDFNSNNTPSHPEVLDRMAREFVASGFDLKYLIRMICNSEAYNLSSVPKKAGAKYSEDRATYSRAMVRRLSPEQVVFSVMRAIGAGDFGSKNNRDRRDQVLAYILQSFNYAYSDDEGSRDIDDYSGSIPQALMMLNGRLLNDGTDLGQDNTLKRIITESGNDKLRGGLDAVNYIIEEIFLATLGRPPEKWEASRMKKHVEGESDRHKAFEDIFWALLNTTEFATNH